MRKTTQPKGLIYKFKKLEKRVSRSLQNGEFTQLQEQKQSQLFRRLQNYATRLRQRVKPAILTAMLALGLGGAAQAQGPFSNPSTHPLSSITETGPLPAFGDLDNDGDYDCVMGLGDGTFAYYENTGTATAAVYTKRTGTANPLDGEDIGQAATPFLVDIDNDGDLDCFVGEAIGGFNFYENTGTTTSPTFISRTGTLNPMDGLTAGYGSRSNPVFVDIDNDGDMDCFSGEQDGGINYYRNDGTSSNPNFTAITTAANPLNSFNIGTNGRTSIAFADLDGDNDLDVVIAGIDVSDNELYYYRNDGSVTNPNFNSVAGTANPFDNFVNVVNTIKFVDYDGDGDMDLFGNGGNAVELLKNDDPTSAISLLEPVYELSIFPNPTTNLINFGQPITGTFQIYNITGQLVLSGNLQGKNTLDLSDIPTTGIYYLNVTEKNKRYSSKITIQK